MHNSAIFLAQLLGKQVCKKLCAAEKGKHIKEEELVLSTSQNIKVIEICVEKKKVISIKSVILKFRKFLKAHQFKGEQMCTSVPLHCKLSVCQTNTSLRGPFS